MDNRVWIYASEKPISAEQKHVISVELDIFLKGWSGHGLPLTASFEILHDHIIVIKADEQQFSASGCSIDKQVHFMQYLEKKTGIHLFNRLLVAFIKDGRFHIYSASRVPDLIEQNLLSADSPVFDFSVSSEDALRNNFLVPLKDTWLRKYLTVKK